MDPAERHALRVTARLVGAVALATVVLTGVNYAVVEFVVFAGVLGPPDAAWVDAYSAVNDASLLLAKRGAGLVALALGAYATAVRDLPVLPCLAGAFVGGLVAAVGQPLVVGAFLGEGWWIVDQAFLAAAVREFLRWTARVAVPAMVGVLLGAGLDHLRGRGLPASGAEA